MNKCNGQGVPGRPGSHCRIQIPLCFWWFWPPHSYDKYRS